MKTNAIIRIILFSLAIMILGSILLGAVAFKTYTFGSDRIEIHTETVTDDSAHSNFSASAADIRNLEIDWVAGSITILPDSNSEHIHIHESNVSDHRYAMHITESGNKLKIEFCEEDFGPISFGIHDNEVHAKDLVISVPQNWICDTLEIDAAAADVNVSDLTIRDVDFDGASGICKFDNCQIDKLDMDTASGDVDFTGTLEILEFDAMSAQFTGTFLTVPNRIDIDSMSGDLEIYLPDDCGFTVSTNTMSGDFTSDFPTTMHDDTHHFGDGHCRISVNAMSGDVFIGKHSSNTHHPDHHS